MLQRTGPILQNFFTAYVIENWADNIKLFAANVIENWADIIKLFAANVLENWADNIKLFAANVIENWANNIKNLQLMLNTFKNFFKGSGNSHQQLTDC